MQHLRDMAAFHTQQVGIGVKTFSTRFPHLNIKNPLLGKGIKDARAGARAEMSFLKAKLFDVYKKASELVLPPLSHSHFIEKGVLTPEEFVKAGDYLVQTCPTWAWEGGDPSMRKPFLPPDKQYLITRNVPCLQRASGIMSYSQAVDAGEKTGEDVEGGDWVATSTSAEVEESLDAFEELPAVARQGPVKDIDDEEDGGMAMGGGAGFTDISDLPDISSLDLGEEEDDVVAPAPSAVAAAAALNSGVVSTRTYDVFITYDKYHQVPRMWLLGYGEDRAPLTQDQVMEDVISDYFEPRGRQTVTVEAHPHRREGGSVLSIHPCRHAEVMKKLMAVVGAGAAAEEEEGRDEGSTNAAEGGQQAQQQPREFKVEHYMVLFLKFISSVVPTIEYDFTMNAD